MFAWTALPSVKWSCHCSKLFYQRAALEIPATRKSVLLKNKHQAFCAFGAKQHFASDQHGEMASRGFVAVENNFAHSVLVNLPAYKDTTLVIKDIKSEALNCMNAVASLKQISSNPEKNYDFITDSNAIRHFTNISSMYHLDPDFPVQATDAWLCNLLKNKLSRLSDEQLKKILSALTLWNQNQRQHTIFRSLWESLDEQCIARMNSWNTRQILLLADYWFACRLSQKSNFNQVVIKRLGKQLDKLTSSELIQYLFYANLSRLKQPYVSEEALARKLLQALPDITVEELGIASMALFKTQAFLKNEELIHAITIKTIENASAVSSISLSAICKFLRMSIFPHQTFLLEKLYAALLPVLTKLSFKCLNHIACLGNEIAFMHSLAVDDIAKIFSGNMKSLRLKEMERFMFVLMRCNFKPPSCPDIISLIVKELRCPERRDEIECYANNFFNAVAFLAQMNIFEHDLISAVLQSKLLMENLSSNSLQFEEPRVFKNYKNLKRNLLILDCCVEIECPSTYTGSRLDPDYRRRLAETYLGELPHEKMQHPSHHQSFILNVKEKLAIILGGLEYVTICYVLPHVHSPDLVFCTTSEGKPQPLPAEYLKQDFASIKYPIPSPNTLYNVVIPLSRQHYVRHTSCLCGIVLMKVRQMQKLGYSVSLVSYANYIDKSYSAQLRTLEQSLKTSSLIQKDHVVSGKLSCQSCVSKKPVDVEQVHKTSSLSKKNHVVSRDLSWQSYIIKQPVSHDTSKSSDEKLEKFLKQYC